MAEPKTKPTKASVAAFLSAIEHEQRRKDAKAVDKIMREVTGKKPVMWGTAIVGYGSYESNTGDWPRVAFSPRKTSLVLYILSGVKEAPPLLKKLGKHKVGGGCLYINKMDDVDEATLRELVKAAWKHMAAKYA
ncbi:MAG: DUF1801 domain-containing protein [Terricaulis sp.]